MATYKTKVKDLKNISNKTDVGGAPFWGDDILGLQINAKADFINTYENLRRRLPVYTYYAGLGPRITKHGMALILSGLTYNNASASAVVVSEGYFLAEGEVCYYPGGTFDCSTGSAQKFLYLGKGAALTESRVFADGVNKEFKVEFGASVLLSETTSTGPTTTPATDLTKDFLFIILGSGSNFTNFTEKYGTIESALKIMDLGKRLNEPAFTDMASFGTGFGLPVHPTNQGVFITTGKMGSRVLNNRQTEISGIVQKTFSGGSSVHTIGTLGSFSFSFTGSYPISVQAYDPNTNTYFNDYTATVTSSGVLSLHPRIGANYPTGILRLFFNVRMNGNLASFNDSFTYNSSFMDVTP